MKRSYASPEAVKLTRERLGRSGFPPGLGLRAGLEGGVDEGLGGRRAVAVAVPRERDQARRHLRAEVDLDDRLVVRLQREPRHESRTHTGADESLHGAVVVGAEDEVEPLPDDALDPLRAPARAVP